MNPEPMTHLAAVGLKLRVALCGQGAFAIRRDPAPAPFALACILPGQGGGVRVWTGSDGAQLSQVQGPYEMPRLAGTDLAEPGALAMLMHGADCETWHDGTVGFPNEVASLVNAALASEDPEVRTACADLYDGGSDLDIMDVSGPWEASPDAAAFIYRCEASEDESVSAAAEKLSDILGGVVDGRFFDAGRSLEESRAWEEAVISLGVADIVGALSRAVDAGAPALRP